MNRAANTDRDIGTCPAGEATVYAFSDNRFEIRDGKFFPSNVVADL